MTKRPIPSSLTALVAALEADRTRITTALIMPASVAPSAHSVPIAATSRLTAPSRQRADRGYLSIRSGSLATHP